MVKSMYFAGTGGQGLQVLGKTIAEAANEKGYYVTYSPKYGAAKRGGLTSCYVVISDSPIGNPRKKAQDLLLLMEPRAYGQFKNDVKPGGAMVINSTLVGEKEKPAPNVRRIDIPLHGICAELGNTRVISAVALGAVAELLIDIFEDQEEVFNTLLQKFSEKPELMEINRKAVEAGNAAMKKCLAEATD